MNEQKMIQSLATGGANTFPWHLASEIAVRAGVAFAIPTTAADAKRISALCARIVAMEPSMTARAQSAVKLGGAMDNVANAVEYASPSIKKDPRRGTVKVRDCDPAAAGRSWDYAIQVLAS